MYVVFNEGKFGTSITATKLPQQDLEDNDLTFQSRNYF